MKNLNNYMQNSNEKSKECLCKEGASDMCKACHLPTQTESEEPCPTCKTGVIKNGIHHTKPTPDNNYKI